MDVQTDERLLINIEGYLIELVCNVESMDEVNLVAEALVSVQAFSGIWPKSQFAAGSGGKLLMVCRSCQAENVREFGKEINIHFPARPGLGSPLR
jgi:hypothetical protein